jgi:hypothetical protein
MRTATLLTIFASALIGLTAGCDATTCNTGVEEGLCAGPGVDASTEDAPTQKDGPAPVDVPVSVDAPAPVDSADARALVDAADGAASDTKAATDTQGVDACGCANDEICVVFWDGTCRQLPTKCKKRTATCPDTRCDGTCGDYFCGEQSPSPGPRRFVCPGPPCPRTSTFPGAVHCYGP